jgi:hypothetical protein
VQTFPVATPLIPPLFSPFSPAIHPAHLEIDARTAAWAERFRIGSEELRARLVTHSIGSFASRILPTGDQGVIELLGDTILWLFGVDDGYCEESDLGRDPGALTDALGQLVRVALVPEAPLLLGDPLAEALRDLRARMDRYGTPEQVTCFANALQRYFITVVWESHYRSRNAVPDLERYVQMRLYDGATEVILPLLEMAYGYSLPPEDRHSLAIRAAEETSSFVISLDNDILSFPKEATSEGFCPNLIKVLQHERQCDQQDALDNVIALRDRTLLRFVEISERLGAKAGPELRQYLDSLACFVRGSQDWEISSIRYTLPNGSAGLPTYFTEAQPRLDRVIGTLDIPAISWWWDDDLLDSALHRPRAGVTGKASA